MFIEDMLKQLSSSLLAYKQAQFNENNVYTHLNRLSASSFDSWISCFLF